MGKNTVGEEVVDLNPSKCWFLFHLHSVASCSQRSSELEKNECKTVMLEASLA